jgi:hypothetical protein
MDELGKLSSAGRKRSRYPVSVLTVKKGTTCALPNFAKRLVAVFVAAGTAKNGANTLFL